LVGWVKHYWQTTPKRKRFLFCTVGPSEMTLDPRRFSAMAVVDTCSVWHMLSSRRFYQAAMNAKRYFCVTPMVLYECLQRPREDGLIRRLEEAREKGGFPAQECNLDDLVSLVRIAPKGLGSGELSCMAAAYRIRSIGFMTDDRKARSFASERLQLKVETTPKLYAWLYYHRHLVDGDHEDIIQEHECYESRPLTPFLQQAYKEAMRCRLMQHSTSSNEV
jgi:hypothetical protein